MGTLPARSPFGASLFDGPIGAQDRGGRPCASHGRPGHGRRQRPPSTAVARDARPPDGRQLRRVRRARGRPKSRWGSIHHPTRARNLGLRPRMPERHRMRVPDPTGRVGLPPRRARSGAGATPARRGAGVRVRPDCCRRLDRAPPRHRPTRPVQAVASQSARRAMPTVPSRGRLECQSRRRPTRRATCRTGQPGRCTRGRTSVRSIIKTESRRWQRFMPSVFGASGRHDRPLRRGRAARASNVTQPHRGSMSRRDGVW
jgi:hypothetical protein